MSGKGKAQPAPPPPPPKKVKEEDCVCYAQARVPEKCPVCKNITHPLRYYEFTQDEIKVLEECDRESFYQRCLPFSTLFAGLTYAAIKYGILKRNPHFGAVPKVLTAGLVGHIYGRTSYIPVCDEKIRELPEKSHLGKTMRKYHEERCPKPPDDKNKKKK